MSYNKTRTNETPKTGAYVKPRGKPYRTRFRVKKGFEGLQGLFKAMEVTMKSPRQGWTYRAARRNADYQRYKECSPARTTG